MHAYGYFVEKSVEKSERSSVSARSEKRARESQPHTIPQTQPQNPLSPVREGRRSKIKNGEELKPLESRSQNVENVPITTQSQEIEKRYQFLVAEKEKLERDLRDKDQQIEVLKEDKHKVVVEKSSLSEEVRSLRSEREETNETIKRYESMEKELQNANIELQRNKKRIQEMEQELSTLHQQQRGQETSEISESVCTEPPKEMVTLREELEMSKSQIVDLKGQLQRMAVGQGIETTFIKEEEFANEKVSKWRQQTWKNLHDVIVYEVTQFYGDLEEDEDTDSNDDSKEKGNGEMETKSKFELLMDRVVSEFLFGVLMESMKAMKERKSKICQMIARQLHVEDNDDQTAEQVVATMIHPQLQQQWEFYFKSKMENQYQIDISDIDTVVDGVYNVAIDKEPYSSWAFLKNQFQQKLKSYISKSAEMCWIMILMKPELSFSPTSFRAIYDDEKEDDRYDEKEKHDLWTGSKTKSGAKTIYFAVPAISQRHLVDKEVALQVLPGQLFAHNDRNVVEYIMSDLDDLMEKQLTDLE